MSTYMFSVGAQSRVFVWSVLCDAPGRQDRGVGCHRWPTWFWAGRVALVLDGVAHVQQAAAKNVRAGLQQAVFRQGGAHVGLVLP